MVEYVYSSIHIANILFYLYLYICSLSVMGVRKVFVAVSGMCFCDGYCFVFVL